MGKKKTLMLETSGLEAILTELDKYGGNLKKTTELALKKASVKIRDNTMATVLDKETLPAKGKFSKGNTSKSVIDRPQVEWDGDVASIPVGFDYDKPGAAGFLIEGTPRMKPSKELRQMYKGKRYIGTIVKLMQEVVLDELYKIS